MRSVISILSMLRPINLVITFITVIISSIICGASFISLDIVLGALSLTGLAASGYILNDIFDIEIDKINRPNRALPSGIISLNEAKLYYLLILVISYIFAFFSGKPIIIFNTIIVLLLVLYSYKLKSIIIIGNIFVASVTASALILGGILTNNIIASIIPAVFAFQVNLIREIIKDIEDIEGDKANNTITFAGKYGIEKSVGLVNLLIVLLIISTVIPFALNIYKIEYFIIVMFSANIIFSYVFFLLKNSTSKKHIKKASFLLKLSMIFGLIAIFFGI
jgi:geranylgeranylglycerol-phosphate geranylgeranyltransferase